MSNLYIPSRDAASPHNAKLHTYKTNCTYQQHTRFHIHREYKRTLNTSDTHTLMFTEGHLSPTSALANIAQQ